MKPSFDDVVAQMDQLRKSLDELPEAEKWTEGELGDLEDVRMSAGRLCRAVEAIIESEEKPDAK